LLLDIAEIQERERYFCMEMEKSVADKNRLEKEKESLYKREDKIEREYQQLKVANKNLKDRLEFGKSNIKQVNTQQVQCNKPNTQNLEEEISILRKEKEELEGLLNSLICNIPVPKLQGLLSKLVDSQTNILFTNKELKKKIKVLEDIECELREQVLVNATLPQSIIDMRTSQLKKDHNIVKEKIIKCKRDIEQHKGTMKAIMEDIKTFTILNDKENKGEYTNVIPYIKTSYTTIK